MYVQMVVEVRSNGCGSTKQWLWKYEAMVVEVRING